MLPIICMHVLCKCVFYTGQKNKKNCGVLVWNQTSQSSESNTLHIRFSTHSLYCVRVSTLLCAPTWFCLRGCALLEMCKNVDYPESSARTRDAKEASRHGWRQSVGDVPRRWRSPRDIEVYFFEKEKRNKRSGKLTIQKFNNNISLCLVNEVIKEAVRCVPHWQTWM